MLTVTVTSCIIFPTLAQLVLAESSFEPNGLRTTYDLNTNFIKYTGLGPLNGGVSNLMPIGLALPGISSSSQAYQLSPSSYSLGLAGSGNSVSSVPAPVVANLQPQPGFVQNVMHPSSASNSGPGGWGIGIGVQPQQHPQDPLPIHMPTIAMEANLGMDSAGMMTSSHEEYLQVLGSGYNPAMASTLYGSDAYHGLSGETIQETGGSGGTQETIGNLAGGANQLYNIATMGDQNQAVTVGQSEAVGVGSVVQQSSSNILHPKGTKRGILNRT